MIRRFRKSAPIPFASETHEWFLPMLLGLMQYLLGLLLVCFLMFHGVIQRWDLVLSNHMTLEVLESQHPQADQMVSFVQSMPMVQSASLISNDQLAKTLQPWLGNVSDDVLAGLPLPQLIDIDLKPEKKDGANTILMQLRQKFPEQAVDISNNWVNDILALVKGLRTLALVLLSLLSLVVVVTVVFVVRSRLRTHQDEIDLLHIMGASDNFIARLFQKQIVWAAIKGSFIAILCFSVTILLFVGYAVVRSNDRFLSGLVPFETAGLPFGVALVSLPIAFVIVAAVTARINVLNCLRRLY